MINIKKSFLNNITVPSNLVKAAACHMFSTLFFVIFA